MQQIRELRLGCTVLVRGHAGRGQILTGLLVHAKETGFCKAVRASERFSLGNGFIIFVLWKVTAV